MKLVRYVYVDGHNTPPEIRLGGYLLHYISGTPHLIGVAENSHPSLAISLSELTDLCEGYHDTQGDLIPKETYRTAFLEMLTRSGWPVIVS